MVYPGVSPGRVLVLGGGIVGTQAAKMAAGLGAEVTIMDINLNRLHQLSDIILLALNDLSNEYNIRNEIKTSDLIVGAVLIPGAKAQSCDQRDAKRNACGNSSC